MQKMMDMPKFHKIWTHYEGINVTGVLFGEPNNISLNCLLDVLCDMHMTIILDINVMFFISIL